MNYDEFIHISGESYNDISPDQYKYEIEPAYMNLPDKIVKDKESFCKFWSKNRELCKFISEQHAKIYSLAKQVASASKNAQDLQAQLTDANAIIKNLENTNIKVGRENNILRLRAAFAPEKLVKEMRLAFFEEYEAFKANAKELGII